MRGRQKHARPDDPGGRTRRRPSARSAAATDAAQALAAVCALFERNFTIDGVSVDRAISD